LSTAPTVTPAPTLDNPAKSNSLLPVLLILFAASGCSALIYEVVWYQMLQLTIGSTSVSLGVLLATYMGGLCIGSIWLPRRQWLGHPLHLYAALEAGIGIFATLVQISLPLLNRIYFTGAEHGLPGMLLRGLLAAICMLFPTILMGASLPAIVRFVQTRELGAGVRWWGFLYGGNTAGAVLGCIVAGFWLLRVYDMATTTYVAVVLNLAIAAVSYLLGKKTEAIPAEEPESEAETPEAAAEAPTGAVWPIYLTIAISGATALGAEIVWTRLLGYLLLATVYVFSIILAVFLTGLAIGSAAGSALLKRIKPQAALGWAQILLAFGMFWTAYTIVNTIPFWTDDVLTTKDAWHMYGLDLKRVLFAIFPSTLFWGASFPLACAAVAGRKAPAARKEAGRLAGGIYAANTLGGIVGALGVSLILIPAIGSQDTERVLLALAALSGAVCLVPLLKKSGGIFGLVAVLAVAALLTWDIDPIPGDLIAYGRRMAGNKNLSQILYVKEGRNSSVAISEWNNGAIYVNVNGHVEATTEIYDMKLQRMVGHLPALLHPNPKSVLGIGFGAGVSAGTFTRYPGIEHITICEIEPVIPPASTKFFGVQDYRVALNPKTHIVFDDARHYLLTTTDKFDIIASDPLDVFVKGTAALYSKEYFESVKQHLNPGGYFTLYVPLYETDEPTIRSELKTFFEAFPYGSVWANLRDNEGYDMVFMGQAEPLKIDIDSVQARYNLPEHSGVRQSLRDIEVDNLYDLFSSYTGSAKDLEPYVRDAAINTDGDLRLSYLAGWGINSNLEDYLYRQMLKYRTSPTRVFTGSPEALVPLMASFSQH